MTVTLNTSYYPYNHLVSLFFPHKIMIECYRFVYNTIQFKENHIQLSVKLVAMFPDLSNYFGEDNVILTDRHDG